MKKYDFKPGDTFFVIDDFGIGNIKKDTIKKVVHDENGKSYFSFGDTKYKRIFKLFSNAKRALIRMQRNKILNEYAILREIKSMKKPK